jgi:transcriptional regulator of acetoin/glycerol metabolism
LATRAELKQRRSTLARTWESLLLGGREGPADLDASVLESWQRSSAWVSPEVEAAPVDDPDDAVAGWYRTPVAAGVKAAEEDLGRVTDDGDLIAAVTDHQGRIVWTHGSRVMRRAAERVNFVPGGRWDEPSVGTNALALALRTGKPSTVYSAEHFSRAVHGWVCYSVPLQDPATGAVLGVLDLSTTWDRAHPLAMSTAQVLGRLITAAMPRPRQHTAGVELTVLGGAQVRVAGRPLLLPQRQVEILLLLALHPEGLSLESLHARLYGDAQVSTSTLKAEVSHLRTALDGGIGSRPYRLTVPVDSDLQRTLRALDAGDVTLAVATARGPLLPTSEAPDLQEWRSYLEVALRTAALACDDVDTVLSLADTQPYDVQLQQHLVSVLPDGDPRLSSAKARLSRALRG